MKALPLIIGSTALFIAISVSWSRAEIAEESGKTSQGPIDERKVEEKKNEGGKESNKDDSPISRDKCLMARPLFGDLAPLGPSFQNWSAGVTVSTQAIKYTFGTEKVSSNTSGGVGIAFRYYGNSPIGNKDEVESLGFKDVKGMKKTKYGEEGETIYSLPVYRIKPECRATTSDVGSERKQKLASSIFSIIPTVYATKPDSGEDIVVQPALLIGFLDDIISVGPGFSLTGPEKGKVFLVLSLGYGFKF